MNETSRAAARLPSRHCVSRSATPGHRSAAGGRAAEQIARLLDDPPQLVERARAVRAASDVRLDAPPRSRRELIVEIIRQLVGPLRVHHMSSPATALAAVIARCCRISMRARCSWRFDVPVATSSISRDLAMLVALDVVQHEDLARARRQLFDRVLEIDRQISARAAPPSPCSSASGSSAIRPRCIA